MDKDKKEMVRLLKAKTGKLKVCEVFKSIQGEGPSTGVPVIFIRLSLCNLHCIWCDTGYTWNWIGTPFQWADYTTGKNIKYDPRDEITEMSSADLVSSVIDLAGSWCVESGYTINTVVLTGGEPLLQQENLEFVSLLSELNAYKFKIELEINGTIQPLPEIEQYVTQYNISPKLSNSGNIASCRIKSSVFKYFAYHRKAFFKFVVMDDSDLEEILRLCARFNIATKKVLLMPEGRSDEETSKRAKQIVKLCVDNGYRFCNRLHVWIWDGSKRGV